VPETKLPLFEDVEVDRSTVRIVKTGDGLSESLEGTMTAQPGDWIIRGVKGELYPCKPDIFAATYEAVDDAEPVAP